MPRELSADTEYVYWWLWHWPWASAADIARITGLKASTVSNALKRGETKLGWFVSARLGRVAPVAARYVVTNKGVAELHERFDWKPFWWHTADRRGGQVLPGARRRGPAAAVALGQVCDHSAKGKPRPRLTQLPAGTYHAFLPSKWYTTWNPWVRDT